MLQFLSDDSLKVSDVTMEETNRIEIENERFDLDYFELPVSISDRIDGAGVRSEILTIEYMSQKFTAKSIKLNNIRYFGNLLDTTDKHKLDFQLSENAKSCHRIKKTK